MRYLTPQIIAEITGGDYFGSENALNTRVTGAVRDNRDVKPGNMFVCIRGARVDGHSFANNAFESGASCCLSEQAIPDAKGPYIVVDSSLEAVKKVARYHRNLFQIPVIGITGSVGKTTTKEMVAAALSEKYKVLKTLYNMNNELGVSLMLLSIDESHEVVVIEMGISDFGEMSRLAEMVRPDICVMTAIGYSHIETLGDLNGVLKAKSEVFAYMAPDSYAIFNGDDELLRAFEPGLRKLTFGLGGFNDFYAESILPEGISGVVFDVVSSAGRFTASIPSYGSHLVPAALAASAVGRLLGLSDEDIKKGLSRYAPINGRANVIETGYITLIDDCYNANPGSVAAALTSLSLLNKRRVAILGDMLELGAISEQKHRDVGALAAKLGIDNLICCGIMAAYIYEGYRSSGGLLSCFFSDKDKMIASLPEIIKKDDAVLVKASHSMKFEEILPHLHGIKPDKS